MVYIYGYLPALFQNGVLPEPYLSNFYKLVRGVRLICRHHCTLLDLQDAHKCFVDFLNQFEEIYVQRKVSRMHFIRQCMHTLWHLAPETNRLGPTGIYAQWTMERAIGILGGEIRLHSNPYSNLAQIGIEQCTVNVLCSRFPELDNSSKPLPQTAIPLDHGFSLLHPHEATPSTMKPSEQQAYSSFASKMGCGSLAVVEAIHRHARLCLPNGQTVRSAWREDERLDSRTNRMVKVSRLNSGG